MFERLKSLFSKSTQSETEIKKGKTVEWYLPAFPVASPSGLYYGIFGESVPIAPENVELIYQIAMNTAEVSSPINALIRETLRTGIQIVPQYRWKCILTGVEYDDKAEALEHCPEDQLVQPDEREYLILEKWKQKVNDYNETLTELLRGLLFDLNVLDNAYLIAIYKYEFGADGEIIGQELQQIIRADPRYMRIIMNQTGVIGMKDANTKVYFCPNDRETAIEVPADEEPPSCAGGIKPFPAHYMFARFGGAGLSASKIYYAPWEVLHVKKFFQGAGYGRSPLLGAIYKILSLMYMDLFIYKAFQKDRPPRGILIMRGNFDYIWKAWEKLQDEARRNPHAIYPIVIEDTEMKGDFAKWIDLELRPKEFDMIELRREMRRVISAIYGVSPVFYDTTLRQGEANSGFIVTNRAVEFEQRILNEKVLPWIVKRIGVRSYTYMLMPPEIRDRKTELDIKKKTVDIVATLRRMGFDARIREKDDGSWEIYIEKDPPEELLGEPTDKALRGLKLTRKQGGEEPREKRNERELERYYEEEPGNQPQARARINDQRFGGEPEVKEADTNE